jgi:hypothetical protein
MKVIEIKEESIVFEDGTLLYSYHDRDCCEHHYLDFTHITMGDFDGLEFNLTADNFFEKVDNYGIRLLPTNGHPIGIPGYGDNNGYYSDELLLIVKFADSTEKKYDVTECQVIRY